MRLPSITTLTKCGIPQPQKCRDRMEGCRDYYRTNFDRPIDVTLCLTDLSSIMAAYGIEYVPRGSNQKSPEIHYVNVADMYENTIMFVNGNFVVGQLGYHLENGNYS